ncbi:polycomb protein Pcl [Anopheles moucheti]|uniref:polycomb protein Pcl n=1 Tax=Anopheles moucheti TaxID=186751 RepID=UPI0022F1210A|nr:polycomb protein Pcl [Anopheles moucheti]
MLGSPVEVRYDDGIVLIQTDGGGPVRASDGGGQPCASDGGGEADAQHASQTSSQESIAASPESRSIIIRDGHREGCGSITIVTTPNNLKISINTKRYDRQSAFQAAKRTLTKDLRNKLGELDMLLKASCDDDDGNERGSPSAGSNRSSPVTVQTQPNSMTSNGTEENTDTTSMMESAGACSLDSLQEPIYLLDDVLVRPTNENEIFYLGTVVDLEPNHDCLVRFGDATERRFSRSSITRCSGTDRQSRSMTQTPTQNDDELQLTRTESKPPLLRFPPELFPLVSSMQLPYDLKNLKWDSNHRVNTTGNYCYCGNDGDWAREMLQCRRCEQWFHGRCVRSLQFPIFHGDTFYVFICSICNHGHEFVRRLVVSASNLAHLVLYNLIMRNGRRFYGLRTAILPYIEDNQRTLQLSDKFLKLSTNERADLLLNTFKSNKNRFYNGKDFNLSSQLWSLHQPVPPPVEPITIPIPPKETITETMLQQKLETTEHFRFLPRVYHERNYFMDGATRERMVGLLYANHPESVEDPRTEFCFIGRLFPPAPEAPKQSNTIDPPSGVASTAQPSTSTQASVVASNNGSNGQVGARRRKRYGIRPTPTTLLTTISGLDRIIPRPSNFDGPNNPFYEDDSSTGSVSTGRMRYAYRKLGNMKRRACDESQPYMSSTKRRKMGPAGSSSLSSAAVSRIRPMRKRALSDVAEESHEELSWHNVQCGSMYMQRRSCATGSSSSGMAEQGEATVATGQICSDGSGEIRKIKQFASGRRSSGRLIALRTKDYSDTRRNKRSREPDTVVQPDGSSTVSRGRLNSGSVTTDDSDQSNGDRVSLRTFSTSGNESSSCAVRKIYWEQEKLATTPADQQQEENLIKCVVVAKRILPDGKQEHLLEEIN